MAQRVRAIGGAIAFFVLGVISQRSYDAWRAGKLQLAKLPPPAQPVWTPVQVDRSHIDYSKQPLWAWGVTQPPGPNDKQAVQFAPVHPASRNASAGQYHLA